MKTDAQHIQYRWLEKNELSKIDAIIEAHGWTPLNEEVTRVLVAEIDGQIIGFHVLQLYPHAEPLYVEREYRERGVAEELVAQLISFMKDCDIRGFQAQADTPFAEHLCKAYGMEKIEAPVYRMPQKVAQEK